MTVAMTVLPLILLSSTAVAADLCADHPRSIEPDMRIEEDDLSTRKARDAAAELQKLLRKHPQNQAPQFDVLNRLQVLRGYTLRQQAIEDRAAHGASSKQAMASTKAFCAWMDTEAFWYD